MRAFIVTIPFGDYAKGDMITETAAVRAALDTNEAHVVRTSIDDGFLDEDPHAHGKVNPPERKSPAQDKPTSAQ